MARRSKGEGTLYFSETHQKWVGQITLPNGKRRTKYGKSQKEVRDWILKTRKSISDGLSLDERMTVSEFMALYLKDYCARSLRPTTYHSYAEIIRHHLLPYIGNIKLSQLTPSHLNRIYTKKLEDGLSNRTVEYIHGVAKRSLNKACVWGLLITNPALRANPPANKRKKITVWTTDQVKKFLDHVKYDRWGGIYYLACGTGMRKSEILGLSLESLKLDEGYLTVTQTLTYVPQKGLLVSEPKTPQSRRLIVLPEFVIEALREHLKKREILSCQRKWQEKGFVFTTDIGTPITPRNIVRHFKSKLEEVGLPEIRFHDLRHTTATLLLEKNVHPKIVQELLGHTSITVTMDTYSHLVPSLQKEAADKMDELMRI